MCTARLGQKILKNDYIAKDAHVRNRRAPERRLHLGNDDCRSFGRCLITYFRDESLLRSQLVSSPFTT